MNLKDLNGSGIVDVTVIQGPVGLETATTVYPFTPEPQNLLLAFAGITPSYMLKPLLTALLFAAFPLLAGATSITSGNIIIQYAHMSHTFDFSGPGFSVSGQFFTGGGTFGIGPCNPCVAPSFQADVNGSVNGIDIGSGSATVNEANFGTIQWGYIDAARGTTLSAVGPSIAVPNGPGTYYGTFNFSATVCGTDGRNPTCLVDLPNLTGSGTVAVTVSPNLVYDTEVYTFVDPTPEPQTWMVAFVGILAILGWRFLKVD